MILLVFFPTKKPSIYYSKEIKSKASSYLVLIYKFLKYHHKKIIGQNPAGLESPQKLKLGKNRRLLFLFYLNMGEGLNGCMQSKIQESSKKKTLEGSGEEDSPYYNKRMET